MATAKKKAAAGTAKTSIKAANRSAAPTKRRINFNLHAPNAHEVTLAGSFNEWDPKVRALKCDKKGIWRTWLNLPPGHHEYLFVVNDQWQEDPSCQDREANPYGSFNSVVQI